MITNFFQSIGIVIVMVLLVVVTIMTLYVSYILGIGLVITALIFIVYQSLKTIKDCK